MSLITRCPACETLFKVVPDQLRISEGWVRCGQCDEIFDASIHLLSSEQALNPPPITDDVDSSLDMQSDDESAEIEQVLPEPSAHPDPEFIPVEQLEQESVPASLIQSDTVIADAMSTLNEHADASPRDFSTSTLYARASFTDTEDDKPDHSGEFDNISFLRDKQANSVWRKPIIRAVLGLTGLLLLFTLLGQIVFHERDRMAASEPRFKPWLVAFCGPLNCSLSPLRKFEAMVIDSASFTKIRGDSYGLNFTIRNMDALELALPAIELTLTDSHEQSVIRRVFLPAELGVKSDALAAGRALTVSLAMVVKDAGAAAKVAGYRVFAFYP